MVVALTVFAVIVVALGTIIAIKGKDITIKY